MLRKGKESFSSFKLGLDLVKMKKSSKKKTLIRSWERPYLFVEYANGKEDVNNNEGGCVCIVKDKDEQ